MRQASGNAKWPVLKRYDGDHLARIALPIGGIGTGTVSLGGRGDLRDWEIANRPNKGFVPMARRTGPFFALYARAAGAEPVARALEGPLDVSAYEGAHGATAPNHGLPRFSTCSFAAAYPLGQVVLSDRAVPLTARIEAFNPLIPGDPEASGIPVAVLRFVLKNRTAKRVAASVCGTVPSFIGTGIADASKRGTNRNTFRRGHGVRGVFMHCASGDTTAEAWGSMALATTAKGAVSFRTDWRDAGWGTPLLEFWDDFSQDGRLEERGAGSGECPIASLAAEVVVPARAERSVTFLLAWHFPNRYTWTPCAAEGACREADRIGNYYAERYPDAWAVAEKAAAGLAPLERKTVAFVRAFCASDLPEPVKEAALFNLSTLRSQTCFRTPDGRFYGWEGCSNQGGCCHGSCTHVWNYEQATAFLFGSLARTMRDVEFAHATSDTGLMSFRVNLPLERARDHGKAAADGQMGCIMKMYRDWRLSGDDALLERLWPNVKKALSFCWVPGGWDADQDGVMEGCQHNTMDVEYYGPNPQMGSWYLGALRAAEEMARYLGDEPFAATCRRLFEQGSRWIDENLFNGEYYEHQVRAAKGRVADGLRAGMGSAPSAEPEYQLGPGCLVDQLVGQFMAHVCGLGYLLKPAHVRKALRSIMKYNLCEGMTGHFNCLRSFALGDESALLMASYPKGRPANPFPYFTEVMTGFEYTAAVGMLYEGQEKQGLRCIENIRSRYDGRKRSPFDEAECGHHYARAMASWAAVVALTGFQYSAVDGVMTFAPRQGRFFWASGEAWGTCRIACTAERARISLTVLHGGLALSEFVLADWGRRIFDRRARLTPGKTLRFGISRGN
ncbi:MAG: hypothetical protein JXR94_04925 [Candidatus Hydrogenedentes bacterium]|nr:hypothetical protein [Candidatus Hydrogenedentota bacterium]